MKEALLKYDYTNGGLNIGDYIQSLAAKQFLNHSELTLISREKLSKYNHEKVKLIMNGWFLINPENYPPNENIKPLLISHHINTSVQAYFNTKKIIDFYKKNEPIGCRDYFTLDFLKKLGVRSYYSGCLTLTLSHKYYSQIKNNKIYFVDPRYKKLRGFKGKTKRLQLLISKFNTIRAIRSRYLRSGNKRSWKKTIDFYHSFSQIFEDEVLTNAIYIKHYMPANMFNNDDEIFSYAEDLLKKYASAKYVVSSRIHCALPCLSLETPILYIDIPNDSEISKCRLNGIKELFHVIETDKENLSCDLLKKREKFNLTSNFINKKDYVEIKEKIQKKVLDFIKE